MLPKVRQQDADLFDAAIKVPRKERRACCKESKRNWYKKSVGASVSDITTMDS